MSECSDCKGGKKETGEGPWMRFKALLARFRRCEPYCDNGDCTRPSEPCATGACTTAGPLTLEGLLDASVAAGVLATCTDPATGKAGYGYPGGACVVTKDDCRQCRLFGPHYNLAVRGGLMSPLAVEQTAGEYDDETLKTGPGEALLGAFAVPGKPGWFYVLAGALNVSHEVCIDGLGVTQTVDEVTTTLTPTRVAVAGTRASCSTAHPGLYAVVFGPSDKGRASDITGQPATDPPTCVRRCRPACAATPAEGGEAFFFQVAEDVAPEDADTLNVTVHVTRCKWLHPVDWCIGPQGALIEVPVQTVTMQVQVPLRPFVPTFLA